MLASTLSEWIDVIQLAALVGGGTWALFIYATSRRGQVRIAIEYETRLLRNFVPDKSLLILNIRLTNSSHVLWRWRDSVATVFDAQELSPEGELTFVPFRQADPLLPVYGITSEDPRDLSSGSPFAYFEGQEISLEPGEQVESELAFPLDTAKLGLLGVKIWFSGLQRRSRKPYEWATFFLVDPLGAERSTMRLGSSEEKT